ncbi:MAG: enoyl-CoA hydratase/isomerase family protein [Deltaproteobacteria bacterium]|jgi:2-(1,2-epoxy-1,2-dihydrophenyl)acetyl-CoA isomerase|nr:enoyl-CoA hydratase/isomerase family protein [Deltaproteobacteria bacterium]
MMEFKQIRYEKDPETGIVLVTLNRPEIKNALGIVLLLELYRAAEAVEMDETASAMILTGAVSPEQTDPTQEAFSSGMYLDFAELESLDEETKQQVDLADLAQKRLCLKLWKIGKPVVAAINGLAIGGGFTIPLACADLIYMSEHAWVKLPFVRLGLVPELASSYLLPRMIGFQRAKEIMFFGERLSAERLYNLGLINRVLPHGELLQFAREQTCKLIPPQGAGLAVRLSKEILHKPMIDAVSRALDLENEGLNRGFATSDFMEALNARMEKRDPRFSGS